MLKWFISLGVVGSLVGTCWHFVSKKGRVDTCKLGQGPITNETRELTIVKKTDIEILPILREELPKQKGGIVPQDQKTPTKKDLEIERMGRFIAREKTRLGKKEDYFRNFIKLHNDKQAFISILIEVVEDLQTAFNCLKKGDSQVVKTDTILVQEVLVRETAVRDEHLELFKIWKKDSKHQAGYTTLNLEIEKLKSQIKSLKIALGCLIKNNP